VVNVDGTIGTKKTNAMTAKTAMTKAVFLRFMLKMIGVGLIYAYALGRPSGFGGVGL
jgi:hypothetical protein